MEARIAAANARLKIRRNAQRAAGEKRRAAPVYDEEKLKERVRDAKARITERDRKPTERKSKPTDKNKPRGWKPVRCDGDAVKVGTYKRWGNEGGKLKHLDVSAHCRNLPIYNRH